MHTHPRWQLPGLGSVCPRDESRETEARDSYWQILQCFREKSKFFLILLLKTKPKARKKPTNRETPTNNKKKPPNKKPPTKQTKLSHRKKTVKTLAPKIY